MKAPADSDRDQGGVPEPESVSKPIPFSVDAALLRELGERLVGRAFVALAELVKNSYDADATEVIIRFSEDQIEVIDNGHGMTLEDFERFWMRIGTPHKQAQPRGTGQRRLTGSKGVGRLAVQFLAADLEIRSVAREPASSTDNVEADHVSELVVSIDWEKAIEADELVKATATARFEAQTTTFPGESSHGFSVILTRLRHHWEPKDFEDLARETWFLQPPFRSPGNFHVRLDAPAHEAAVRAFEAQLKAILDIWRAKLSGRLERKGGESQMRLRFQFAGERAHEVTYTLPPEADSLTETRLENLYELEFEIRVYSLAGRQDLGIKVGEARDYLRAFGGVHIYDAGFHVPFYGRDTDWLDVDRDTARRLSESKLVPKELQVTRGLLYLPQNDRLLGEVRVNTSLELAHVQETFDGIGSPEPLAITVTRDRLLENASFGTLRRAVRWAIDYYAMQEARVGYAKAERERGVERPREPLARVESVLKTYESEIPATIRKEIATELRKAIEATEKDEALVHQQQALLGSLATAGMAALAYEHEMVKQFAAFEGFVDDLRNLPHDAPDLSIRLEKAAIDLEEWIARARETRTVFADLMQAENREVRARLRARPLIERVIRTMGVLLRGTFVDMSQIDSELRLPEGTQAEWSALFQNVFVNAVNAMWEEDERRIRIVSVQEVAERAIIVEDTGRGIDLAQAERLFEPFERRTPTSQERRTLGLGGTGLGLTIVRMIADNAGAKAGFVAPKRGFATAFRLGWREKR